MRESITSHDYIGRGTEWSCLYIVASGTTCDVRLVDLESITAGITAALDNRALQDIPYSVKALALTMRVVHVPELHNFSVAGDDGRTHSVSLFPNETCTCPASTRCCHVIAARRSIGIDTTQRKPINLTNLRRNARYEQANMPAYCCFYCVTSVIRLQVLTVDTHYCKPLSSCKNRCGTAAPPCERECFNHFRTPRRWLYHFHCAAPLC